MYLPNKVTSSYHCAEIFRKLWDINSLIGGYECLYAFYLSPQRFPVFHHRLNEGNHTETNFDVRRLVQYSFNIHSDLIVIAHNHTSGKLSPSETDIKVTASVCSLLEMLDIKLIDHIIITADGYYSFKDNGLI